MRKNLSRFRELSPERRRAVTRAGLLIAVIRTGLAVLPFRYMLRAVRRAARPRTGLPWRPDRPSQFDKGLAVWAVEAAGRRLLTRNPCLPQALAVLILFRRAGEDAELHMGVTRDEDAPFKAHAWIESDGVVVIGGDVPVESYARLQGLETGYP